jgi:DDE superfamily endonuclease
MDSHAVGPRTHSAGGGHFDLPRNRSTHAEKNELKPWKVERFCIPGKDRTRFVVAMEGVLREYEKPDTDEYPLICMDEAAPQVLADAVEPLPVRGGVSRREDYHYERLGVRSLFLFIRPFGGWRRIAIRERRTALDWALEVRQLLRTDFPKAKKVRLVCDNLNTHNRAALYTAFGASEGLELAERLEFHYTPINGSWLNMAELELSVLQRQCLDRRFASLPAFGSEVNAWVATRNAARCRIEWRFRTNDARRKLAHMYPTPQCDSLV